MTLDPIAPGVWSITLGQPEALTPLGLREEPVLADALADLPDGDTPWSPEQCSWTVTPRGVVVRLPLHEDDRCYGLGLQLQSLEQTNRKKTLRVNSDPVADAGDSHAPVPVLFSTRGWGLLIDSARYVTVNVGTHTPADQPPPDLGPSGAIADNAEQLYRRATRPRGPLVIEVPSARGVRLVLFAGPTLRDAVQRHVLFSGGGCLPPLWGLGVWYRGYVNHTQDRSLACARQIRDDDLPCDVFGLEPGWHSHAYACTYAWHPDRFPEPERYLADVQALGFRPNLWEHAFVDAQSPIANAIAPHAGDQRVWTGLVPDLTRPEARAAFARHHAEAFVSQGVSGFKLDECDNSDFVAYPWSYPEYTRFPSGLDGEQMHCLLGILYQRMIHGMYRQADRRTLSQVRASHLLAAPHPFVLYTDLYDHAAFIRGVVTAGFSGLLWCPEIRQCASTEDLIRRVQTVVFSAQALVNGWMIDQPPWKQVDKTRNNAGELMPDHAEATAAVRTWFQWRMRLLPALYAAFARYRFTGVPPVRALVMDHPDDAAVMGIDDQWLLGDSLLVAPVIAGQTARGVYLPAGDWFDLFTDRRYAGGQTIHVDAPLDRLPVFVRAGTLLPVAEPLARVAPDAVFDVTFVAYGGGADVCRLYEDDGETFAYERGAGRWITARRDGDTVTLDRPATDPATPEKYRVAGVRVVAG